MLEELEVIDECDECMEYMQVIAVIDNYEELKIDNNLNDEQALILKSAIDEARCCKKKYCPRRLSYREK